MDHNKIDKWSNNLIKFTHSTGRYYIFEYKWNGKCYMCNTLYSTMYQSWPKKNFVVSPNVIRQCEKLGRYDDYENDSVSELLSKEESDWIRIK